MSFLILWLFISLWSNHKYCMISLNLFLDIVCLKKMTPHWSFQKLSIFMQLPPKAPLTYSSAMKAWTSSKDMSNELSSMHQHVNSQWKALSGLLSMSFLHALLSLEWPWKHVELPTGLLPLQWCLTFAKGSHLCQSPAPHFQIKSNFISHNTTLQWNAYWRDSNQQCSLKKIRIRIRNKK